MLAVVATVFAVGGLAYFGTVGVVDPAALVPGGDTDATRIFASYLATRNVVLGGALLMFLALRSWRALSLVLLLNGAVQVLDAMLGQLRHELSRALGPAVAAVLLIVAATVLVRQHKSVAQTA